MKNKFLIFTLCFTILISSININKSYADSNIQPLVVGSVTVTSGMIATISTVAVASGITLLTNDDVYNVVRLFVDKYKDNWDTVQQVFDVGVSIASNKVVSVSNDFLNLCKDVFDSYFLVDSDVVFSDSSLINGGSIDLSSFSTVKKRVYTGLNVNHSTYGACDLYVSYYLDGTYYRVGYDLYQGGIFKGGASSIYNSSSVSLPIKIRLYKQSDGLYKLGGFPATGSGHYLYTFALSHALDIYNNYNWENNISANLKNDSLDLNVPKDLTDLVGLGVNGVLNPSYPLTNGNDISLPNVSNPSIDWVEGGITVAPSDTPIDPPSDTPTDTPTTWDWLINLVVPSSSYWSETFDTFFTNIGNAFPMIDISRFKDLCINGVPPKDIEVSIMGSRGTIFNTKYLNSIIDWLQPIVSAFMAFLLMLYNYRKVYKLIRGFEPFSGLADGQSVGEVRGKMDGSMPEMGNSSFVGPSSASTWSDGQSVTRGSIQSRYYGRDL